MVVNYASPTSGEAYRDRRLTTNFELWVEIFCVSTCFHVRIPKPCLSAPREKNPLSFVNICPTLVIDTSMEWSSRVLHHGNPKIFPKKFEIWLLTKNWNHRSFVDISPTLLIDTSMERSSRVLATPWKPKSVNFSISSKLTKLNSVRTPSFRMPRKEIALISVLHK